jgi:hypothetical protein
MHVAEVLDLALREENGLAPEAVPKNFSLPPAAVYAIVGLGVGLIAGALLAKRSSGGGAGHARLSRMFP